MIQRYAHYFLLLICILVPGISTAQPASIPFKKLTEYDGLSHNNVSSTVQDKDGFLWIGTSDGLNRFDGYSFVIFRHKPTDSTSIGAGAIAALFEDSKGRLWIGTIGGGLCLYDPGKMTFKRHVNNPADNNSLSDNRVRSIVEDGDGILWIGTYDGLNSFDPESGTFRRYVNDPANPNSLSNNSVSSIVVDPDGRLWIGTRGGLNAFRKGSASFTRYLHDEARPGSIPEDYIMSLFDDGHGTLWMGTLSGFLITFQKTSGESRSVQLASASVQTALSDNAINAITLDASGNLWVGKSSGALSVFDPLSLRLLRRYEHAATNPQSLSSNDVTSVYSDREGVMWIGTMGGGVNRFFNKPRTFPTYQNQPDNPRSLSNNRVTSFATDKTSAWIGTIGGGLNQFDLSSNRFTRYLHNPRNPSSISSDNIYALCDGGNGSLWIGTYGGGLNLLQKNTGAVRRYVHNPLDTNSLSNDFVRCLLRDSQGSLWIGTSGGGVTRYHPSTEVFARYRSTYGDSTSLSSDLITGLAEGDGIIWVGTYDNGVNALDPVTGKVRRYVRIQGDSLTLSSNLVTAVYDDHKGNVWIGTAGGGLNRLDIKTGKVQAFGLAHGLPNEHIYGIVIDTRKNLWLSTGQGLCRIAVVVDSVGGTGKYSLRIRRFDASDGLPGNDFNQGGHHKDKDGFLYFGSTNGFTFFHPDSIRDQRYIPPVRVTMFQVFSNPVLPGDQTGLLDDAITETTEIVLPFSEKVFSFEFSALSFNNPDKNQYAYMMEGFDQTWTYTTAKRRFVTYTNLSPGKYTFRVRAANSEGVWNDEGVSIRIVIRPPWWRTIWAYSAYAFVLISVLYGGNRVQRSRLLKRERQQSQIREAELRAEAAELQARALQAENERKEIELEKARELEHAYQALDESHRHLKSTQEQLIHSEKMASLGQLTAGIAHEIKNPLNFVNNFSTLSVELFSELEEELQAGKDKNVSEVAESLRDIIGDLRLNVSKINEHGKRADSIVRSMLLHSSGETGERQPTDINVLVEEYLNLAFHGIRAKDSSFQVTMKREYDQALGQLEIVPQEISRVVLNLITNAMHAVDEKAKKTDGEYTPTVTVRTRKTDTMVCIDVEDNGTGIPEAIRGKIFQPFFTTKPTGTGTGLGLSLSYDIVVKGHRGDLTVTSVEGQGSTFTVSLPVE